MITNRIYDISGFLIVKAKQAMPNIPYPHPTTPEQSLNAASCQQAHCTIV